MTRENQELLDAIEQWAEQAPEIGLCAAPFRVLHTAVMEIITERDVLAEYRTAKPVIHDNYGFSQCPNCGEHLLETCGFCDSCGQKIAFVEEGGA